MCEMISEALYKSWDRSITFFFLTNLGRIMFVFYSFKSLFIVCLAVNFASIKPF